MRSLSWDANTKQAADEYASLRQKVLVKKERQSLEGQLSSLIRIEGKTMSCKVRCVCAFVFGSRYRTRAPGCLTRPIVGNRGQVPAQESGSAQFTPRVVRADASPRLPRYTASQKSKIRKKIGDLKKSRHFFFPERKRERGQLTQIRNSRNISFLSTPSALPAGARSYSLHWRCLLSQRQYLVLLVCVVARHRKPSTHGSRS